jgi:hypothetical protein
MIPRRSFLASLAALCVPWKVKEKAVAPALNGLRGLVDDGTYLTANVWGVGPPLTEARLVAFLHDAQRHVPRTIRWTPEGRWYYEPR